MYFQWWRYDATSRTLRPSPPVQVFDSTSDSEAYYRAELVRDSLDRIWVQAFHLRSDGRHIAELKYGRRNFDTRDGSRNTLPVDLVTMGELYQNNHHARPANPNFAARWPELDPTWWVMRALLGLKLIQLTPSARAALAAGHEAQGATERADQSRGVAAGVT